MNKKLYQFISLLLFVLSSKPTFASCKLSDTSYVYLDSIVIKSRLFDKAKNAVPYSVVVKNASTLKNENNRTTPEALMGASGVFVQKTNHGGGSAFIRGLTGNQTLLMLDGIRINNATFRYGPNQYLNTIDLYTVNEISVYKGTGSVEYGSDAIGGLIHLQTNSPRYKAQKTWSNYTLLKYTGRNMEKTVRSSIEYAQDKWAIQVGGTFRNFGDLIGGKNVGTQIPSGYAERAINGKVKIKLSSQDELTFSSQTFIQTDVPIYHKVVLENFKINKIAIQEKGIHYLKWEHHSKSKLFSSLQFIQSLQFSNEERESNKNNASIYKFEKDQVRTYGSVIDFLSTPTKNWKVNSGIEYYSDLIGSQIKDQNLNTGNVTNKRGLYPDQSNYKNLSIFSLHKIDFKHWYFEAGVRWNQFKIELEDNTIGQIKFMPKALVGNVGLTYKVNKNHFIHASISSGYRAPNIDDMGTLGIVDFRYELPSSQLKPEQSIQYELGYTYQDHQLKIELSGFYLNLTDIINRQKLVDSVIQGYPVYIKQNAEASYIKGFDGSFQYALSKAFNFSSNLTYTYGQNSTKNEPMRRIPPLFGANEFKWKNQQTQILIQHQFAGKQNRLAQGDKEDNRIGPNGTPNWNLINLIFNHQIKNIQFQLSAINLLNEKYKTHGSGIYGMGRTYSIQMHLNL